MSDNQTSPEVIYVCPEKDILCGDRPAYWCKSCPRRPALIRDLNNILEGNDSTSIPDAERLPDSAGD